MILEVTMRARDVLAGLGIAVALLGFSFAVAPSIGAGIDLSVIPVQFVGFAAVGLAVLGFLARRRREGSRADPPVVETMPDLGRPGADADTALTEAKGFGILGHTSREQLRDRIYSLAIETIVATDGCTRDEAAEILREGTWTDEPRAIAMFSAEPPPTPMGDVLAGIVTGRSQFVVQATHAIEALDRRLQASRPGASDGSSGTDPGGGSDDGRVDR